MDDYSFLKPISRISPIRSTNLDGLGSLSGTSGLASLLSSAGKTGQTDGSLTSEFKDILLLMLKGFSNNSMNSLLGGSSGLGGEEGGSDMFGMSSSMMMMPLMLTLLEKMMALETQTQAKDSGTLSAASGIQLNQFDAETGGDGVNANCGPASLVMGLHALGLRVSGESETTSRSAVIDLARLSMVNDPARDGVDEFGNRSEAEHNTFTTLEDLAQGARAAGAGAKISAGDTQTIRSALESGAKVLVSGTFDGKDPLPWTGDRAIDNQSAPGFAGDHIVAVTGYDSASGKFIVNDPARSTPIAVDAATLSAYMAGNAGAVILTK